MFGALWLSTSALEYLPAPAAASEQTYGWKYDAAENHECVFEASKSMLVGQICCQ
jgi:hypothetical protein